MDQQDLPLGFALVLAENPSAMRVFSSLPEAQRTEILHTAKAASSRDEMHSIVRRLEAQP